MDKNEHKVWVEILNLSEMIGMGWLCNLHFLTTDIETVNNQTKLKKGCLPIAVHNAQIENCNHCESCTECIQKLELVHSEYEKCKLKTRLNFEIEQYKTNDEIAKLKKNGLDQREKISALKQRVALLENLNKQLNAQTKKLQEKVLVDLSASNVQVLIV